MKLYVSLEPKKTIMQLFEMVHLIEPFTDGFVINNTILYEHGIKVIKEFKKNFPQTFLFVDCKIVEHGNTIATMLTQSGADCISVMAGVRPAIIHNTSQAAREKKCKTVLDLSDSCAPGQSALEAQSLGIYALFFHLSHEDTLELDSTKFVETWQLIQGNSSLPIILGGRIEKDSLIKAKEIDAYGIVMGKLITQATDPVQEAKMFFESIY